MTNKLLRFLSGQMVSEYLDAFCMRRYHHRAQREGYGERYLAFVRHFRDERNHPSWPHIAFRFARAEHRKTHTRLM